jgi:outer membrane protein OmpA-like peptidoglycan-associated protein
MSTRMMFRLSFLLPLGLVGACTPVVPPELADARRTYQQVSTGPAAQVAPAELHKAAESLAIANKSFEDDPGSQKTKDLAYVAERKAELADAIAHGELARRERHSADRTYSKTQTQIIAQERGEVTRTKEQLAAAEQDRALQAQALGSERAARADAEQKAAQADERAKEAQASLAKLAAVKQEDRGLVITLSGSVLFASNQAVLLPEARTRLDQVAAALLATKERKIVIEGYTDSRGSDTYNEELSRRRADAVREYIVSRGYDGDLVTSTGMGKARPVADNGTAEGRANNRRVEIVVQPKKADTN